MLYVCAVPLDADVDKSAGTPMYILDIITNCGTRKNIGSSKWGKYRLVFNWSRIWIVEPEEMKYRKIVNIKFHQGETV